MYGCRVNPALVSVGDDWLAVLTIFAPALIPLIYAVGLWVVFRGSNNEGKS
jgi:hypothetical protein